MMHKNLMHLHGFHYMFYDTVKGDDFFSCYDLSKSEQYDPKI